VHSKLLPVGEDTNRGGPPGGGVSPVHNQAAMRQLANINPDKIHFLLLYFISHLYDLLPLFFNREAGFRGGCMASLPVLELFYLQKINLL